MTKHWSSRYWVVFLPIAAWLLVMAFSMISEYPVERDIASFTATGGEDLIRALSRDFAATKAKPLTSLIIAQRGMKYAYFTTLANVYLVASLLVIIISVTLSLRSFAECGLARKDKCVPWIIVLFVLVVFATLSNRSHVADFILTWKGFGDFLRTIDHAGGVLHKSIELTKLATTVGFIAAFAVLMLACACLYPYKDYRESSLALHRSRIWRMDVMLVLGAFLLALAILRDRAFFSLIDAFLEITTSSQPDKKELTAVMSLSNGINSINGIYYSMLASSVFLTDAWILSERNKCFVANLLSKAGYKEKKKWLEDHGLLWSLNDKLIRLTTALVPALTGNISDITKIISGGV